MNLLTPSRMVSKNAPGEANNSCLVEISKWEAITKMARYGMVIDINKCTGCYNCFLTCRDEFAGNEYPRLFRCSTDDGHELDQGD